MVTSLNKREQIISFIFLALLFLILVTLSPLSAKDIERSVYGGDGNILQQVVYLALFGFLFINLAKNQTLYSLKLFPRTLLLLLTWATFSILWSAVPDITFRRLVFSVVIIFSLWGCIFNLPAQETYRRLLIALLAVVAMDIVSAVLLPHLAIHQSFDLEQAVVGDWRGIHFHKNIAGSIAAVSFICWIWRFVHTKSILALVATILSLFLLIKTGSKTSLFLAPTSFIACAGYFLLRRSFGRAVGIMCLATIISICSAIFLALMATYSGNRILSQLSELNFTGRTEIWRYLWIYIEENPILGSGYLAFWNVGNDSPILSLSNDWVQFVTHGHSGYLDIAVSLGLTGLILLLCFVFITPYLYISKIPAKGNALFPVFINLWLFGITHNILESSFMDRTRISWVFMLIGIFGLIKLASENVQQQTKA